MAAEAAVGSPTAATEEEEGKGEGAASAAALYAGQGCVRNARDAGSSTEAGSGGYGSVDGRRLARSGSEASKSSFMYSDGIGCSLSAALCSAQRNTCVHLKQFKSAHLLLHLGEELEDLQSARVHELRIEAADRIRAEPERNTRERSALIGLVCGQDVKQLDGGKARADLGAEVGLDEEVLVHYKHVCGFSQQLQLRFQLRRKLLLRDPPLQPASQVQIFKRGGERDRQRSYSEMCEDEFEVDAAAAGSAVLYQHIEQVARDELQRLRDEPLHHLLGHARSAKPLHEVGDNLRSELRSLLRLRLVNGGGASKRDRDRLCFVVAGDDGDDGGHAEGAPAALVEVREAARCDRLEGAGDAWRQQAHVQAEREPPRQRLVALLRCLDARLDGRHDGLHRPGETSQKATGGQ